MCADGIIPTHTFVQPEAERSANGDRQPITSAADVWALGSMLVEALTEVSPPEDVVVFYFGEVAHWMVEGVLRKACGESRAGEEMSCQPCRR